MMRVTMLLVICTSRNSASMPWATVTSRSPAAHARAASSGPATTPSMASSIAMDRRVFRIESSLPWVDCVVRGGFDRTGSGVMVCPWKKGVKDAHLLCREHMICPLPRASDLSALRAVSGRAMVSGGDHALYRGRCGASHEDPASHRTRVEWSHHVVAGSRHPGPRSAEHAALARPLRGGGAGGPV